MIGMDVSGLVALGNASDGIYAVSGAISNTIGGSAAGAGNLIAGNGDDGLDFDPGTVGIVVQGNKIGTTADGLAALGNGDDGLVMSQSTNNVIGGTTAGAGNLIAGNSDYGVSLRDTGTSGNLVQGNTIWRSRRWRHSPGQR